MTKIRLAFLAVLVLAVLGLPPVFGMLAESQVDAHIEAMRSEQVQVTVDEYDRGWFSSRAQLTLAPARSHPISAALADVIEPVTLAIDVSHGPISFVDGFFLGLYEVHARPADPQQIDPLDFTLDAQATLGGATHFRLDVLPFRHEIGSDVFSFSGTRVNGTYSRGHVDAEGEIESIQVTSGGSTFSAIGLHASWDTTLTGGAVMPGTFVAEIDRLSAERSDIPSSSFDASGLVLESRSTLDDTGELLDGSARFVMTQARMGQQMTIDDVLFEMSGHSFDVAAIEAYYALMQESAQSGAAAAPTLAELEPIVLSFLGRSPSMAVDTLRFNVDGQPFEASLEISADSAALPAGGAANLEDPSLWMALLKGRTEITAAKPLVERIATTAVKAQLRMQQAPGQDEASTDALARAQVGIGLGMLSAQGLIEDTGTLYRTEASFENGQVTVNGQPLPFPMMP